MTTPVLLSQRCGPGHVRSVGGGYGPALRAAVARGFVGVALLTSSGCMVGPNYTRPAAATNAVWMEAEHEGVQATAAPTDHWWDAFGDPVLSRLVETAYAQNLTLRVAGLRVIEAQARRSITIGNLFPQQQELTGSYTRMRVGTNGPTPAFFGRDFNAWQAGFDAAWELDVWGKFRRAIEAADADLLGAVANYDDVLVSLVAEVAATYVQLRVLDERLTVARDNVRLQQDGLAIARVRFEAGGTSELDVHQATTLLRDTEATIPQLEIQQRQAVDGLSVLLGRPPSELEDVLGAPGRAPAAPATVMVGIPADLLRRRPDVRRAERAAAAQSARIGVAYAELLPAFQLIGSVGLEAKDVANLFEGNSFTATTGPAFNWPVLNYGRLISNVRLQDATFQELAVDYANAVLVAQREVEDALIGALRGNEQVQRLAESVAAANRAVEISLVQYRQGAVDFTSVLNTQQAKLREDDLLVSTRGAVALSVIALYKALGGGWAIGDGQDFVPDDTRAEMRARTEWGNQLAPAARTRDVEDAQPDGAGGRWWPKW